MKKLLTISFSLCGFLVAQGQVTNFPYTESFENGLGLWVQSGIDDMDWTRKSGSTPTGGTGPSAASDGTYFLYTEATGNYNKEAVLESPEFIFNSVDSANLSFGYHMWSINSGWLKIELSIDDNGWSEIFYRQGHQSSDWINENIQLAQFLDGCYQYSSVGVKIRITARTGPNYVNDIAIDNVSVSNLITSETSSSIYPSIEDFELAGSQNGQWHNSGFGTGWERGSGPTPTSNTGPDAAYSGNYYLYYDASSFGSENQIYESQNYVFGPGDLPVIGFAYHMQGSNVESLKLHMTIGCDLPTTIWEKSGSQGSSWIKEIIDLTQIIPSSSINLVSFRFEAASNSNTLGDIGLDLIEVSDQGYLPSETIPLSSNTYWTQQESKGLFLMNGQVAINTDTIATDYALQVNGSISAEEIKVEVQNVPDYVFESGYSLRSLEDLSSFIKENGHLPDVAPAQILEKTGINSGEFNMLLLRKIEELTLYMIELHRVNKSLMDQNELLSKKQSGK
ncbi:MAG: hypothetical protein RIF33_10230 [Cyclobacteriaceae bacterium]